MTKSNNTVSSSEETDADRRHGILADDALSLDLVSAFAGDRPLTEMEYGRLNELKAKRGPQFFSDLFYAIAHQYFAPEVAESLWAEVVRHKYGLSKMLGRNVKIAVAALDYLSNITDNLDSATLVGEAHIGEIVGLSLRDGLTGLFNHTYFYQQIDLEMRRHARYAIPVSLMLIDIDDFKAVNDTYGHSEGDRILAAMGQTLLRVARDSDICCRYGGEEFAIILPSTGISEAGAIANRLKMELEERLPDGRAVTVSIGVASCGKEGGTHRDLVNRADDALYQVKRGGKNHVLLAADGSMSALRRKAGDDNAVVRELNVARIALESERCSRQIERDKARSQLQALESDLTEERYQRDLEQREAFTRIDVLSREKAERIRFFTIISHDMRAPIANLSGFLDLLLSNVDDLDLDQIKTYALRLRRIVDKLSHLTESLLTWAQHKLDRFQCEYRCIDMKALIEENIELFSESCTQKGISLRSTLREGVTAYADHDMINAVVRNVLSNAVKFTRAKGTIQIEAESGEEAVVLSVSDDGVGMAKDRLCALFEPAADRALTSSGTEGERGAGLGLLLCKELVRKNEGAIWVESQEGRGTTVFLSLKRLPSCTTNQQDG